MMATENVAYAVVSPLKCGYLSPPASKFVPDTQPDEKLTMPSMAFLIQHPASNSKIVFDLSIRKDLTKYHPGLQKHIATRNPLSSENDVKSALALGGLSAEDDIDYVIVSHIHWDHVGTPGDFTRATFIAGHNTSKLLRNEMGPDLANPYYEHDLFPADRTIELPAAPSAGGDGAVFNSQYGWHWTRKGPVVDAIDMFNDGTVYIVDSPGHVPGHLNALVRIAENQWIYLAADACHHSRIFKGDVDFGSWTDDQGRKVTIHKDLDAAYRTLGIMRRLRDEGLDGVPVEVVLAHDGAWEKNKAAHFFPNHL
jgi:glyoxylase-like metal-dependent hydrolase (beta-lactamase superfamily II)